MPAKALQTPDRPCRRQECALTAPAPRSTKYTPASAFVKTAKHRSIVSEFPGGSAGNTPRHPRLSLRNPLAQ